MVTVTQISYRALIALAMFMLLSVAIRGHAQEPGRLLITEIQYDPPGLDAENEWVEIANTGDSPLPLDGMKLGDEEQPGGNEGMARFPPEAVLQAGQVAIIAQTAAGFRARYGFDPAFEWQDSAASVPDMLPYDAWAGGDVALNNEGDELLLLNADDAVIDAVSYGQSSYYLSPSIPATLFGQSVERVPAHCDRNIAGDWVAQSTPTPGAIHTQGSCAEPIPEEIAQLPLPIGTIQGRGERSPRLNQSVVFEGVVTGILEDRNTRGAIFYTLFVQDKPGSEDGLAETSDAIAVFHGPRRPPYLPGDHIRVRGQVTEFFGLTEIDDSGLRIELIASEQPLPDALQLTVDDDLNEVSYEAFESMLVTLPKSAVIGPTFGGCGFTVMPGTSAVRLIHRRETDPAGLLVPILHISDVNCGSFPQVKVGDVVTGLRGPLTYHFDQFKIVVQDAADLRVTPATLPAAPAAPHVNTGQAAVATFNLHDFFDAQRNSGRVEEPVPSAEDVEIKRGKLAQVITDVLGCPALVAVQEVENESLLRGLADHLEPACGFRYGVVHGESPDARGIDLGLLHHRQRTAVIAVSSQQECSTVSTAVFDASVSCPPGQHPLFSRPPLRVDLSLDGLPYTVIVTHFKSKREGELETSTQRLAQAQAVADSARQLLADNPEARVIVLGDFNDYEESAPMQLLRAGPSRLVNATASVPLDGRYTYNFGGISQLLDAILVSPGLVPHIVASHIMHVNADYPAGWAADAQLLFRSSDHDIPLIIIDTGQGSDGPEEPTSAPAALSAAADPSPEAPADAVQAGESTHPNERASLFPAIGLVLLGAVLIAVIAGRLRRR